ncbi:response regulator [Candidatus Nomurabacteria bacterium]|nr:response regulator [Candidatus Nomurabacteria bacterium]
MTETTDNNKKPLVVMIDDDSFLLDMYSMKFKKGNYEVMVFTKAEECLEKLRDGLMPDALLCDIIMPGMDGWTFVKQVRENRLAEDSKIIILSNQGENEEKDHAAQFKVDGFIVKAMSTPSEVVKKVEEYLSK